MIVSVIVSTIVEVVIEDGWLCIWLPLEADFVLWVSVDRLCVELLPMMDWDEDNDREDLEEEESAVVSEEDKPEMLDVDT